MHYCDLTLSGLRGWNDGPMVVMGGQIATALLARGHLPPATVTELHSAALLTLVGSGCTFELRAPMVYHKYAQGLASADVEHVLHAIDALCDRVVVDGLVAVEDVADLLASELLAGLADEAASLARAAFPQLYKAVLAAIPTEVVTEND